jgi:hypothetical protein
MTYRVLDEQSVAELIKEVEADISSSVHNALESSPDAKSYPPMAVTEKGPPGQASTHRRPVRLRNLLRSGSDHLQIISSRHLQSSASRQQ